jgi:hypothetical protein
MTSIRNLSICAAIFVGFQFAMLYANMRISDVVFYAVITFLVVLNLITIYILVNKQRRKSTTKTADLSGIEVMYN